MSFTSLTIEAANFMKMVQTPGQTGAEYEYKRSEALGLLRSQAKKEGGVFSQFATAGANTVLDNMEAQQRHDARQAGGVPT